MTLSVLAKHRQATGANGLAQWWPAEVTAARVGRLAKEAVWVMVGQVLAVAGAVVGVRVLTELLPPEAYGELALGMTAATLLNQVVFGPLSNGASRFYAVAQEEAATPAYLGALTRKTLAATGWILALALPVITLLLAAGYGRWLGLVLVALAFGLLSGYNGILDAIQNAARQRSVVAWHQGLASWGRFLVAAGLIVLLGSSSTVALVGFATALTLALVSQGWFSLRLMKASPRDFPIGKATMEGWRDQVFAYSWPFAAWGWLTWAQQASDRWALGFLRTTDEVGQYAVLYQLGYYPMMLASGMVLQLVGPVLFQRAGTGRDLDRLRASNDSIRSLAFWTGIVTLVLFGLLFLIHRPIFSLMVAEPYRGISGLLPWMVLAGGTFAAGQVLSLEYMTSVNTRSLVTPKIVTAILGVVLNLIGAALYGVVGVVVASALWSVVYVAAMLAYARRAEPRLALGRSS
jgi:O-antigen/teichoic acid export membrane protein